MKIVRLRKPICEYPSLYIFEMKIYKFIILATKKMMLIIYL